MMRLRYSRLAESDLDEIGEYTLGMWGEDQALAYVDSLEAMCLRLCERPGMGRPYRCNEPKAHRLEHRRHVIFYSLRINELFVGRFLHCSMLPENHVLFEDR